MKEDLRFEALKAKVVSCRLCPRLVDYREKVKPSAAYADQEYWRKPVPGFGDIEGRLLILGLAPARNGAERTGRIFTGDASSRFLVSALYATGFTNQPTSESRDDGLTYHDCYITAVVKCVPPGDKPLPSEFANCSRYLESEILLLKNLKAVLALGAFAFTEYVRFLKKSGVNVKDLKFSHGAFYRMADAPSVYASYHPSPRNTNTGKLTKSMLVSVLTKVKRDFSI